MIRVILLAALISIGAFATLGPQTAMLQASRKLLFLVTVILGCIAVLFPEIVQDLAVLVGVGRGTDLLVYAMTIGFLAVTFGGYLERKRLDRREATIVETVAILEAQVGELRERLGK